MTDFLVSDWSIIYKYIVIFEMLAVPLICHKHSVISDVKVTLGNFCFEWLSGAMMHIRIFHFCLANNRQQVAQLCIWAGTVKALLRHSSWSHTLIHFLLADVAEGSWDQHIEGQQCCILAFWVLPFSIHEKVTDKSRDYPVNHFSGCVLNNIKNISVTHNSSSRLFPVWLSVWLVFSLLKLINLVLITGW